jgi:hypothetical protein
MTCKMSSLLLATTAFALVVSIAPTPVRAATKTEMAMMQKLQEQISALQKEIDQLKQAQAKSGTTAPTTASPATTAAASTPVQTPVAVATAPAPAATTVTEPTADPRKSGSIGDKLQASIEENTGVKLSLGGYFDMTSIYRQQNQNADSASNWNASIPYANSREYRQSEFRASARNTRISLTATAKPDEENTLGAFVETDFAGVGTTSSANQTSNYTPRLRQAFATYENSDLGLHILGGQTFSLTTMGTEGIQPRKEALPMVLDSGYLPGYVYTRDAQMRVAADFANKKVWAALSVEAPNTNYGGIAVPSNVNSESGASLNGASATSTAAANLVANDIAPDIVAKMAFDPGFGHYEIYGLTRFFHDRTVATNGVGGHDNEALGLGGGTSAYFKVVPKKMEVVASFLGGKGIGRYATAQLPDYAFTPSGDIKPLTEIAAYAGIIGHPTPTWDLFLYSGIEQTFRENFTGTTYGYGNFDRNNDGCYVEGGSCSAQTQRVWQVTGGAWKSIYKGNFGNVQLGLQSSITRKDAFSGLNDKAPHAYESVTLTSFRYTPKF